MLCKARLYQVMVMCCLTQVSTPEALMFFVPILLFFVARSLNSGLSSKNCALQAMCPGSAEK